MKRDLFTTANQGKKHSQNSKHKLTALDLMRLTELNIYDSITTAFYYGFELGTEHQRQTANN